MQSLSFYPTKRTFFGSLPFCKWNLSLPKHQRKSTSSFWKGGLVRIPSINKMDKINEKVKTAQRGTSQKIKNRTEIITKNEGFKDLFKRLIPQAALTFLVNHLEDHTHPPTHTHIYNFQLKLLIVNAYV